MLVGDFHGVLDVIIELVFVGDDFHGAAAEDESGADEDGIADGFGDFAGLFGGAGDAAVGLFEAEFLDHFVEEFAVFGGLDGFDGVPMMGTPASLRPRARLSGVWPPNWTMTPDQAGHVPFAFVERAPLRRSPILRMSSWVRGSKKRRSLVS